MIEDESLNHIAGRGSGDGHIAPIVDGYRNGLTKEDRVVRLDTHSLGERGSIFMIDVGLGFLGHGDIFNLLQRMILAFVFG